MNNIILDKKGMKSLINEGKCVTKTRRYIYDYHGRLLKFNPVFLEDFSKTKLPIHNYGINIDQITWLNSMNGKVSSSLPDGVILYNGALVGVTYPKIFYDYDVLTNVTKEEKILFFKNLKEAINKHIELISHGIYNKDFLAKNVLYKEDDVELIDLDGKYIKNTPCNTYDFFANDLKSILLIKMRKSHTVKEYLEIKEEIDNMFNQHYGDTIDYPLQLVKKVEKMNVILK